MNRRGVANRSKALQRIFLTRPQRVYNREGGIVLDKWPEPFKKWFYRRLREGRRGSIGLYGVAGISFWLLSERRLYCGTRVVEVPWALKELKNLPAGTRILQVGDVILKAALAKHEVELIDLKAEEMPGSGLKVQKLDIREASLPADYFDIAVSLSTLEHIGYAGPTFADGDRLAAEIVYRALKPRGLFLFSVPFGKTAEPDMLGWRVYDRKHLDLALGGLFEMVEGHFLVWDGFRWTKRPPQEVEQAGFLKANPSMNRGIALVKARKIPSGSYQRRSSLAV